ncbi:putative ammonium transporter 1, partial [Eurytemora carolleeae]|uniref:putative ammonium transporter 1 n=1 Tax=Eurytemora carolleeae TaxID=1294199 RepID=UPI000C75910E
MSYEQSTEHSLKGFNYSSTTSDSLELELGTLKENLNHFFLCVMGAIIFFMQAGFAYLESGSLHSKNVTNTLIRNLCEICFG